MANGGINFDIDNDNSGRYPKPTVPVLQAQGCTLLAEGDYPRAIKIYSEALAQDKTNKICLLNRSLCHLRQGECEAALKDADTALAHYPDCYKPIYAKAEALYGNGEFESALVFYHRGHKVRPSLRQFTLGIYKAQEALSNSVGKKANIQLTKEGDLTSFSQVAESRSTTLKPAKMNNLINQMMMVKRDRFGAKQKTASPMVYKEESKNATAKKLLGRMYKDRIFLKRVFKTNDRTTDTGVDLHKMMYEGLTYLAKRTEFWRQQHPLYAKEQIRKKDSMHTGHHHSRLHLIMHKELEKIEEMFNKRQTRASVKRAKKLLELVSDTGAGSLRNREQVVANLHSIIGNCLLEMHHFHGALHHHKIDRQIGQQHNMPDIARRATDNLGRCYARMHEYGKAIETWTLNLVDARSDMERVWLHHEIGRCCIELGKYSEALEHGEEAADCVDVDDDPIWEVNVSILMAQALFRLKNYTAAHSLFERALNHAIKHDKVIDRSVRKALKVASAQTLEKVKAMMEKIRRTRKSARKETPTLIDPEEDNYNRMHHPPDYRQSFSFKSPLTRRISPSVISSMTSSGGFSRRTTEGLMPGERASPMSLLSVGRTPSSQYMDTSSIASASQSVLSETSTRSKLSSRSSTVDKSHGSSMVSN